MTPLKAAIQEMRERCEAAKLGRTIIQRFDNDGGDIHYQIELEDVCRDDMIFASVWDHKARAEFVRHSTTDIPKLLSALEVTLEALEEAKRWCELGSVELPPRGKPRLSEIMDEAISKAEQLLTGVASTEENK